MKILVVIINYRTAEMTLDSVRAALRELTSYPDARVCVVDNNSGDGSLEILKEGVIASGWTDRVQVVGTNWNGGFAYGCNQGIRPALSSNDPPDYIYLLNSDAFPDRGAIGHLVAYLDQHPEYGIAGSYIHGVKPDLTPHTTAFRFPSLQSEFEAALGVGFVSRLLDRYIVAPALPTKTSRVDWLAGASMLVRREVFETTGLMDEGYFLYFEETDFCLRSTKEGWLTAYVVESEVTHVGSASTGYQDLSKPTPPYWFASRYRYLLKNHGRGHLWLVNAAYIIGGTFRRLRTALTGKPGPEPRRHMRDFLRFNLRLGAHPDFRPPRPEDPDGSL